VVYENIYLYFYLYILLDEDGWDYYFINAPCCDFIARRGKLKVLIEVK